MKLLEVDKEKCISCMTCVAVCPGVFRMTDKSEVIDQEVAKNDENIEMVINSCPGRAITWKE